MVMLLSFCISVNNVPFLEIVMFFNATGLFSLVKFVDMVILLSFCISVDKVEGLTLLAFVVALVMFTDLVASIFSLAAAALSAYAAPAERAKRIEKRIIPETSVASTA
jgi:hypothetical protein